jgi:hypothetical protein
MNCKAQVSSQPTVTTDSGMAIQPYSGGSHGFEGITILRCIANYYRRQQSLVSAQCISYNYRDMNGMAAVCKGIIEYT